MQITGSLFAAIAAGTAAIVGLKAISNTASSRESSTFDEPVDAFHDHRRDHLYNRVDRGLEKVEDKIEDMRYSIERKHDDLRSDRWDLKEDHYTDSNKKEGGIFGFLFGGKKSSDVDASSKKIESISREANMSTVAIEKIAAEAAAAMAAKAVLTRSVEEERARLDALREEVKALDLAKASANRDIEELTKNLSRDTRSLKETSSKAESLVMSEKSEVARLHDTHNQMRLREADERRRQQLAAAARARASAEREMVLENMRREEMRRLEELEKREKTLGVPPGATRSLTYEEIKRKEQMLEREKEEAHRSAQLAAQRLNELNTINAEVIDRRSRLEALERQIQAVRDEKTNSCKLAEGPIPEVEEFERVAVDAKGDAKVVDNKIVSKGVSRVSFMPETETAPAVEVSADGKANSGWSSIKLIK